MGDAEVEIWGLARFINEDVPGLEVAMDDSVVIYGVLHRIANQGQQIQARSRIRTVDNGRTRRAALPG